jgi:DNA-directed RNA polymerase specialized sigma24 family protein
MTASGQSAVTRVLRAVEAGDPTAAERLLPIEMPSEDVLALDEALESLRQRDKRKCDVVMLRYFAGLTIEETSEVLNISEPTGKRGWRFARALLHEQLNPEWSGKTN